MDSTDPDLVCNDLLGIMHHRYALFLSQTTLLDSSKLKEF